MHPLRFLHLPGRVLIGLILHKTNIELGIDTTTALSYGHKSVLSDYQMICHTRISIRYATSYSPQPLSQHTAIIFPTYQKCKVKMNVMLALSVSLMAYGSLGVFHLPSLSL